MLGLYRPRRWDGTILVGAIVSTDRLRLYTHAIEPRHFSRFMDGKLVSELGSVKWLNPIFILYFASEKDRNNVHLGIQQHIWIFEIVTFVANRNRLMSSNRASNHLSIIPLQE